MEIRFTPTGEDAVNALRAQSVRGWAAFQFILLLALLFLVGIYLIEHEFELAGWIWLAVSAAFGIATYEIPKIQARRAIRKDPSAQGEVVFNGDDTGTVATYSTGKSQLDWRAYTKHKETDQLFLMFFSSTRCVCLPKRVMPPEQIEELRTLLKTRVRAN